MKCFREVVEFDKGYCEDDADVVNNWRTVVERKMMLKMRKE